MRSPLSKAVVANQPAEDDRYPPKEAQHRFEAALRARDNCDRDRLDALYQWFLPLLALDTVPKFVQLIKLAQEMVGIGSARVRAPRLDLVGKELEAARDLIAHALEHRPAVR